jgi:D-amino peptidase
MKVYLMTDLEGVAGVYAWENREDESAENHERRMRQRRWLAEEVSAAADGFFAGGASEFIVNDGHGAGYTIDLDQIDPRVEVINGRDRPFWLPYLDETCDATGIVGGHAKAGTPSACLCHTMSGAIRNWTFNGISMGEMGLQAAIAGHYGVPFVFATGDAHACREMEELIPGVVTVPVKTGMSRLSARHVPPARARELIREGAEAAAGVVGAIEPLKLEGPILFRDERVEPTFDEENPPEHSRVLDAHTRQIEAQDIIDLMYKIYSYPRDWKPLESGQI